MPIKDPVSWPTRGTCLYAGSVLVGGASGISSFGSGQANKIDITTLTSDRRITRKGLIDEGNVSIDGIYAPQSDAARVLEDGLQSNAGSTFIIRAGGTIDAAGYASGKGAKTHVALAYSAIVADGTAGAEAYKITLGNGNTIQPIVEGDAVLLDGDTITITRVDVESGNGVVWVNSATDISDNVAGTLDVIRPAIVYEFTGTIDAFTRDFQVDEVIRYSLTIGSIANPEPTLNYTLPV